MNSLMAKNFFGIFLIINLSACSLFSPVPSFTNTYSITEVPQCIKAHKRNVSLLIMNVESEPIYDTNQMAYALQPYQIAYFAKNGWAETPAQMFQPLIAETLQNTNFFLSVDMVPSIAKPDYILNVRLLELKQEFYCKPSQIRLRMRAHIIDAKNLRIIASKEFNVTEPAPFASPYGGVIAANRASLYLLSQLASFCLTVLS